MANELAPCPFCGNEPLLDEIEAHTHGLAFGDLPIMPDHPGSWTIECPTSGCCGMIADTRAEVIAAWNRRAPVARAPGAGLTAEQREKWLIDNPSWCLRWRIHPKKQIEQWQMVDDGESWGQWGEYRAVLNAAIEAKIKQEQGEKT